MRHVMSPPPLSSPRLSSHTTMRHTHQHGTEEQQGIAHARVVTTRRAEPATARALAPVRAPVAVPASMTAVRRVSC